MAYKFQLGAAVLSGSIKAEDGLVATDVDDTTAANVVAQLDAGEIPIAKLAATTISGKALGAALDSLSVTAEKGLSMSSYNGSAAVSNLQVVLDGNGGLEFNGATGIRLEAAVAGNGLAHSNGVLSVTVDDSTIEINSDSLRIKDSGVTNAKLTNSAVTVTAGDGLSGGGSVSLGSSVSLAVGVDDSSIETNADVLRVKALGVTNAMLAGSIANSKLANSTISGKALGANLDSLSVDDSSIEFSSGTDFNGSAASNIRVKASGITNSMLAGSITNAKLTNSTISGIALGGNLNNFSAAATGGLAGSTYNGSAAVNDLQIDLTSLTADAAFAVASDKFLFYDASEDSHHTGSFVELASGMAGDGLSASAGALAVGVDDSSIETNGDNLRVKALGVTNAMLAGSITNTKLSNSTISGIALGANLNTLSKAANGGVNFTSYNGSAAVSNLQLDLDDLAAAVVDVAADSIAILDATDDSSKKESIADIMTAVAGDALAASSGVLAVQVDDSSIETNSDSLRIKALGVTNAMLAGSITNAKLSNSAMTIAGTSVSLGGTITAPTMLNVDMGGGFTIGSQADDVATFTGGVIVGGNLTVNGSVTSVNSATIEITSSFTFEGSTPDANETVLGVVDPTADATINLPAMSAGTYFLPVLEAASTTAIAATPAEINAIADASARSAAAVDVSADHFMFCDGGATGGYKVESLADYATAIAGDGLAASAGVLAIGVDDSSIELNSDALRIKASGVTNAMLNGSIADSKLNQITTANKVDVAAIDIDGATDIGAALVNADLFLVDDGASGTNRKVTMSRIKTYIGGGSYAINTIGDEAATLAVGLNAPSEAATASRTWTLPASAGLAVGDTILIKAYGNAADQPLTIAQAGSQEIDGSTENLVLESNNAAIQLVYVAADTLVIF